MRLIGNHVILVGRSLESHRIHKRRYCCIYKMFKQKKIRS